MLDHDQDEGGHYLVAGGLTGGSVIKPHNIFFPFHQLGSLGNLGVPPI